MTLRPLLAVAAALLATACSESGGEAASKGGAPETAASPAQPAAPAADAEAQTLRASLPAPYDTADLANGKRQFAKCRSCHTLDEGGADMTGPNLHGVFGRTAGTKPGYRYSDALKTAGFAWDADKLDRWLADPRGFLPGNKMSFAGVKAEKDRVDLIAYLKTQTGYRPAG